MPFAVKGNEILTHEQLLSLQQRGSFISLKTYCHTHQHFDRVYVCVNDVHLSRFALRFSTFSRGHRVNLCVSPATPQLKALHIYPNKGKSQSWVSLSDKVVSKRPPRSVCENAASYNTSCQCLWSWRPCGGESQFSVLFLVSGSNETRNQRAGGKKRTEAARLCGSFEYKGEGGESEVGKEEETVTMFTPLWLKEDLHLNSRTVIWREKKH